jgi:hypothetical protein
MMVIKGRCKCFVPQADGGGKSRTAARDHLDLAHNRTARAGSESVDSVDCSGSAFPSKRGRDVIFFLLAVLSQFVFDKVDAKRCA